MSRDISGCQAGGEVVTGIWWGEARNAVKYAIMHGTAPFTTKNSFARNVSNAQIGKS